MVTESQMQPDSMLSAWRAQDGEAHSEARDLGLLKLFDSKLSADQADKTVIRCSARGWLPLRG